MSDSKTSRSDPGGEPAFPAATTHRVGSVEMSRCDHPGFTKREWIAAQVAADLATSLVHTAGDLSVSDGWIDDLAGLAARIADSLLRRLERGEP